jgi:hypothetical protein
MGLVEEGENAENQHTFPISVIKNGSFVATPNEACSFKF